MATITRNELLSRLNTLASKKGQIAQRENTTIDAWDMRILRSAGNAGLIRLLMECVGIPEGRSTLSPHYYIADSHANANSPYLFASFLNLPETLECVCPGLDVDWRSTEMMPEDYNA